MSFLSTTAKLEHHTPLPPGTTRAQAIAMLSDYDFYFHCNPHMDKYELIPPAQHASLNPPPSIPDSVASQLRSTSSTPPPTVNGNGKGEVGEKGGDEQTTTSCYRVTDIVHAIPAGIWDTNVVSTYELTKIRDGLFVRIRSPLSTMLETFWEIRDLPDSPAGGGGRGGSSSGEEGGGGGLKEGGVSRLELVESVTATSSRFLVGIVKASCENGWREIHGTMVGRLEGELRGVVWRR
ncbi:hypothetical protein B0J18DRAFT_247202 [Chaetomium sp. MPI-SDFR-AT-0129]|nr:hypothetical protein B0J18DRAFT_247202 [Chaetomium sp. MPI-SDFR-AT-0129]